MKVTLLFLEIPRKAAAPPPGLRANRFWFPRTMTTRTEATPKLLPRGAPLARGTRSAGASDARSLLVHGNVDFWYQRTSSFPPFSIFHPRRFSINSINSIDSIDSINRLPSYVRCRNLCSCTGCRAGHTHLDPPGFLVHCRQAQLRPLLLARVSAVPRHGCRKRCSEAGTGQRDCGHWRVPSPPEFTALRCPSCNCRLPFPSS